jgi:predicted RNA-binding Zn-ribbon protein involved in translation (DUF1610 family)
MNSKNITLEIDGTSVTIETCLDVTAGTLSSVAANVIDELKSRTGNVSKIFEVPDPTMKVLNKSNKVVPINPKANEEREPFRDRLPNEIDIKDLKVTKAKTQNTIMRCPSCGQAHCGILMDGDKLFLMRRKDKSDTFDTVMQCDGGQEEFLTTVSMKEDDSKREYYESLQLMNVLDETDFVADKNTEVFCPVCHKSNKLAAWMDAYDHPEKYFEYAYVCDVCGSEMVSCVDYRKQVKELKCEECGHVQDMPN